MLVNFLGFEITPKIDAGHIAIVLGVVSTWLVSWRKAKITQIATPYRIEVLEAQLQTVNAQNTLLIQNVNSVIAKQRCIEKTLSKAAHDGANVRTVTGQIFKEVHKNGKTPEKLVEEHVDQ